jgi:hypothetical protein
MRYCMPPPSTFRYQRSITEDHLRLKEDAAKRALWYQCEPVPQRGPLIVVMAGEVASRHHHLAGAGRIHRPNHVQGGSVSL